MSLLPEALRLTQWFNVFPLGPGGKPLGNCRDCSRSGGNTCPTPEAMTACKCVVCHSFYVASDEKTRVEKLWYEVPSSLIGIRTGGGFVVVDFDKHGAHDGTETFNRWREEGVLRNTWIARTGGDGLHLYYALPEDMVVRNGQPLGTVGVDIKGSGGYVVAPPSAKEGQEPYRWMDGKAPWNLGIAPIHPQLLETIVARPERRAPSIERMSDPSATLNLFHWFMNTFPMGGGNRNNYLFQAACVAGECVEQGFISEGAAIEFLKETAREAGLRDGEISATIASGINKGINNIRGTK